MAASLLTDGEYCEFQNVLLANSPAVDLIKGGGRIRKIRFPGHGRGKSGGVRTIYIRSRSRSLYPDGNTPVGRCLIRRDDSPLFGSTAETDDIETGTIYVLRSLSNHPFVDEHRELTHKNGVTGGKAVARIASAEKEATYLLATVALVAT